MLPSTSLPSAAAPRRSRRSSSATESSIAEQTPSAGSPVTETDRSAFEGLIEDRRDAPFVRLSILLSALLLPSAALLAWPGQFRWVHAVVHLVAYVWFLGPYTLMLHNTSHRRLYNKRFAWLNDYVPVVLGPFFGQSPHTYAAHHVGMHHAENNLSGDLSTTLPYQRDSVRSFLAYLGKFFLTTVATLPVYFWRRGRKALFRRALLGEVLYLAALAAFAGFYDWRVALVLFIAPFIATRCAMMAGNWAQHAFVDQDAPQNTYRNSITCIDCTYNERCFNDGYHIGHHVMAARHWTEMPGDFEKNREKYAAEGAIVFRGIDFFIVWALLMMKRYDTLAKHYVELDGAGRTRAEIEELLRSRTRRFAVVP